MGEVILASTTDTQADIEAVVGVQSEEKPEVKEHKPEKAEAAGEGESEEQRPTKSAVQKRIDKLTREKHEAQRQAAEVMERLAKLEAKLAEPEKKEEKQEVAEEKGTPRPKEEDFKTWEEFQDALTDWKVEQRLEKKMAEKLAEMEKAEAEAQAAEERKKVFDIYSERVNKVREKYDDFDDVAYSNTIDVPQVIIDLIPHHEYGPDLQYYLGSHRDVCKKLCSMSPSMALVEVGQILKHFAEQEQEEEADEEKPRSKAPAPIRPLSGSSTKSSVPADELPYQEFRRLREQQIKNRYKR